MAKYNAIILVKPSLSQTAGILWPPDIKKWFRLLVISLFIGTGLSFPFPNITPDDITSLNIQKFFPITSQNDIIFKVILGILLVILIYSVISSVFQFVFVDYLSNTETGIFYLFKKRIFKGLQLLLFYLILLLIVAFIAFNLVIHLSALESFQPQNHYLQLKQLALVLFLLLISIIPLWILSILTTDFVVPMMIKEDSDLISGWKIISRLISKNYVEIILYMLVKIFVYLSTGLIIGIIISLIGILTGFSTLIFTDNFNQLYSTAGLKFYFFTIFNGIIILVIMLPVITFLRVYSLIFLDYLSNAYNFLSSTKRSQKM